MTSLEKTLAVALVIVLIICVVLGVQKSNIELEIGAVELRENELRQEIIYGYDNEIESLNEFITTLQAEREQLNAEKAKVKTVTIRENDSIARLPYDEQNVYIANGLSLLDSIERRHFSGL